MRTDDGDSRFARSAGETSEPLPPRTRIWLCGEFRLEIDGRDVAATLPRGQAGLLLAFLLTRPRLGATREELIAALWPEQPPADPYALLRPLLSRLRRTLAPAELEGRERLVLALPTPVQMDIASASQAVERAREAAGRAEWVEARARAADAYEVLQRELLPGLNAEWIEVRRV